MPPGRIRDVYGYQGMSSEGEYSKMHQNIPELPAILKDGFRGKLSILPERLFISRFGMISSGKIFPDPEKVTDRGVLLFFL